MRKLKISACTANYGHADLFAVAERLAAHGFDGVEITVMYHAVPAETDAARRAEIRKRMKDCGLAISALHFIFGSGMQMASDDPSARRQVIDHTNSVLDLAHDLEAPVVVIGGGGVRSSPKDMDRAVATERVLDAFAAIAKHGQSRGVAPCFESLNRYETNLGRTFSEIAGYIKRIGSPALKIAGDTFHMNIDEPSISGSIEQYGHLLGHLHLPDSNRLAPGTGHIDFHAVLAALDKIDFQGFVSFEFFWIAPDIIYLSTFEECDAEVRNGIAYVRKIEAEMKRERLGALS